LSDADKSDLSVHSLLYGSASCVNGKCSCQQAMVKYDPTELTVSNQSPKNLSQLVTSLTQTNMWN